MLPLEKKIRFSETQKRNFSAFWYNSLHHYRCWSNPLTSHIFSFLAISPSSLNVSLPSILPPVCRLQSAFYTDRLQEWKVEQSVPYGHKEKGARLHVVFVFSEKHSAWLITSIFFSSAPRSLYSIRPGI